MKAAVRAMSKGAVAEALAAGVEVKKSVASKLLDTLATVATAEVKKAGVFTIPGLARLKIRVKPATKAGKREVFGKVVMVKAKPATKAGKREVFGKVVMVKAKPATNAATRAASAKVGLVKATP